MSDASSLSVLKTRLDMMGGAKMDVGPKKLNGIPDKISWPTEGAHLPLENIPVLPTVKLPDEALRAFEQAQSCLVA